MDVLKIQYSTSLTKQCREGYGQNYSNNTVLALVAWLTCNVNSYVTVKSSTDYYTIFLKNRTDCLLIGVFFSVLRKHWRLFVIVSLDSKYYR